ncbi:MAG TPA: serine/threonine-protein kinase [Kofleriaceae bacterium]|nr:serine/threonine-protein kinase [Kofleriaceae bacterium]
MNRPAPTDTADVTIATEVDEQALPAFASQGGDLDATQWVDPVEQAILLDRTRPAERHATQPPIASCARPSAAAAPAPAAARRLGSSPPEGAGQAAAAAASGAEVRPAGDRDQLLEDERPTAEEPPKEPPLAAVAGEDMLGNYRVLAPLASGGMGLLYLGEHRFLGYRVAIKILQPKLRGDAEVERRFFAEAVATSRIGHPGVPTVLDFGHDRSGTAYLVMEYLEGQTLAAHMTGGTAFSLEQLLDFAAQLASILAAAHKRGVLHRDIKPDNVFLCPDTAEPSGYRVKLLDFGVAKLLADRPPDAETTRHDFLVGTAWYMAPEQTFGPAGVDERCDIYALGCVLFQLLTGRLPFCGEFEAVVQARRYTDPPRPRDLQPHIPRAVDALVHRMLARQPDDRPASMRELERELRTLLVGVRLGAVGGAEEKGAGAAASRLAERAARAARRGRELVARAPRWAVASGAAAIACGLLTWLALA